MGALAAQAHELRQVGQGGFLYGRDLTPCQCSQAFGQVFACGCRQADIVRGDCGGQEEVALQQRFALAVRTQDLLHERADQRSALLHHPKLAGAQQDRLAPTGVVQVGLHDGPALLGIESRESTTHEILLKRQV